MFGNWSPSAVVFDCDGLLVDTEPCWTTAETEMFAKRGLSFTPSHKAALIGRSAEDNASTIADIFGEPEHATEIEAELTETLLRVVTTSAKAMPGAVEIVARIGELVPVAVASNAPRTLLDAALERAGLTDAFAMTVSADEVRLPKPHPEIYLAACEALNAEPATALAFEDSMTGLRSAQAAGLRVIGIPTLKHEPFPAEVVIRSLLDPDLSSWVGEWRELRSCEAIS